MPTELSPISTDDKIASLKREIALRERVYPRFVASGKMSQAKSDREIEIFKAVLTDYLKQKETSDVEDRGMVY